MLGDTFHLERIDVFLLTLFVGFIILGVAGKLPSVESIRKLVAATDDRGGNITLLAFFTAWTFATSVRLLYWAISLIASGKLDPMNAILMLAVNWVTASGFGLFAGALLKTLTGAQTVAPPYSISAIAQEPPKSLPVNPASLTEQKK